MRHTDAETIYAFWSQVEKTDSCWLWTGKRKGAGYGNVRYRLNGVIYTTAHSFSSALHDGPIPPGKCVLHHCDNPPCVRPDHLWRGTQSENLLDASSKGRLRVGESNHRARITDEDVRQIRALAGTETISELSRRFGVARCSVRGIIQGKYWKHVT